MRGVWSESPPGPVIMIPASCLGYSTEIGPGETGDMKQWSSLHWLPASVHQASRNQPSLEGRPGERKSERVSPSGLYRVNGSSESSGSLSR